MGCGTRLAVSWVSESIRLVQYICCRHVFTCLNIYIAENVAARIRHSGLMLNFGRATNKTLRAFVKAWNGTDVKILVVQVCDFTGDAFQREEWERWLPLVPLPELRANI